jgi:glyoxylase-like metal-dependent hydrolase (beta-lactamase superfamily II)
LSLVTTGRTNGLALAAPDGLVLVDSGAPEAIEPLMTSLRPLGRVSTVFNTHFHPEHTGGNEALRQAGAAIVAHENTRLWMATPTWLPDEDRYRPPRPKAAHPTKTFHASGSTQAGGERIDYGYLLEAHTSGDIYVFFRDANVLAVGDVASPARDPELDFLTGAWIGGRADALARLVELSNDDTRIVPGFGPVMTRAQLQAERDMMKTIYDRTVDRVREGDGADDMLDAGVLNGLPRTLNDPRRFLYDLQKGLWAHHNKLSPNVV